MFFESWRPKTNFREGWLMWKFSAWSVSSISDDCLFFSNSHHLIRAVKKSLDRFSHQSVKNVLSIGTIPETTLRKNSSKYFSGRSDSSRPFRKSVKNFEKLNYSTFGFGIFDTWIRRKILELSRTFLWIKLLNNFSGHFSR